VNVVPACCAQVRRSLSGGMGGSSAGSGVGGMMAQASVVSSQDLVGSLPSYSGPPPSPIATQSLPSFDEADESIVCIRSPKACALGLCNLSSLRHIMAPHVMSF